MQGNRKKLKRPGSPSLSISLSFLGNCYIGFVNAGRVLS